MKGRNIPPFITLTAAMIACIICIVRHVSLFFTLKVVLLVMLLFYIIGRIVQKTVVKINDDAEKMAEQRQREERELAARELEAQELREKEEEQEEMQDTASFEEELEELEEL
ncbi:MAG: hypothetical protein J1E35_05740 [Lachnospiraceae bacterium]|nr:hypothetical protein [Lachnospiraceae bacterium]